MASNLLTLAKVFVLVLGLLYVCGGVVSAQLFDITSVGSLDDDFYEDSCPSAESIVFKEVKSAVNKTPGFAAGLIRLHFHDCFVRGCDASVLIDSTPNNTAEKDSPANNPSLRGFEVIDSAKARLESICPGIVSCADILAFAARDSANLGGRRDGRVSLVSDITGENIPSPGANVTELTQLFAGKGLSQKEMVILSGAHTIGVSHCNTFVLDRLYNFNGTNSTDPSLDPDYAEALKAKCPQETSSDSTLTVPMDPSTPTVLDIDYYSNVLLNRGLFVSDATLLTNKKTLKVVNESANSNFIWWNKFADAMKKMGKIDVLTGTKGEIRLNCRVIN
ncbi:hypothetical protein SUGI_0193480 [Cryptomeria japonica]|nr:hypothetical protein SUGI_0193480 [Cryptomeria japonica]